MLLTYLCEIIRNQKDFVIDRTDEELPKIFFFFFFFFFDMLSPENCHVPLTLVTPSYDEQSTRLFVSDVFECHPLPPPFLLFHVPETHRRLFSNFTLGARFLLLHRSCQNPFFRITPPLSINMATCRTPSVGSFLAYVAGLHCVNSFSCVSWNFYSQGPF